MRESEIERKVKKYAEGLGWLCLKLRDDNYNGFPDRTFLRGGEAVFVEFKQKGKKPDPLQAEVLAELRGLGFRAVVVDSVEVGRQLFDYLQRRKVQC